MSNLIRKPNEEVINVKKFGAVGDGISDDTLAIQKAADYCYSKNKKLEAVGTFKLTATVNLRFICFDFSAATLNIAHDGLGVYVGGNASNPDNPSQHLGTVIRQVGTDSYNTPSVRCIGAKVQHITVEFCEYFQCYADTKLGEWALFDYACAYSTFILKNCNTVELTTNMATTGSLTQWINENFFYLNTTSRLLINGTYGHNHNYFEGGCFEGNSAVINMQVGSSNYVRNIRNEGTLTVTFETGVKDCIVSIGWVSSGHRYPAESGLVIQNRGAMCAVQHLYDSYAPLTPIVGFDYQNLLNSGTEYNVIGVSNVSVGASNMTVGAWASFYNSGLIPIAGENAVFEVNVFNLTSGGIRTIVTGYDSNKVAITPKADQVAFDGSPNRQFGQADTTINTGSSSRFYVLDQNCSYITISVIAAGSGANFGSFYLGCRIPDIFQRKKLEASTFTTGRAPMTNYSSGTWTPVDASGAGLTLTVNNATYTKIGRMVLVEMDVTYPTTTNGNQAKIGGLTYNEWFYPIGAVLSNASVPLTAWINGGGKITLLTTGASGVTNSTLSGKFVRVSFAYQTT